LKIKAEAAKDGREKNARKRNARKAEKN
jgi:hypothetical protein